MFKTIFLLISSLLFLSGAIVFAADKPIERIFYAISPVGTSVYEDMGIVDLLGEKRGLVIFKTDVAGFHDTERIYSDPKTSFPLWIERYIDNMFFGKEFLTEHYFPVQKRVVIKKYKSKGGKQIQEYKFKANGPIQNAVLLPFSIRKDPNLKIGWSTIIRLPVEYKVTLVSLETVDVPAGTFSAFHFTSVPKAFEIWISTDKERIPVKIKGVGFPYTLVMQERSVK
ncbi:MAG: hypothetical protein V1650_04610 [Candidatus Omnitrophota bacterium]